MEPALSSRRRPARGERTCRGRRPRRGSTDACERRHLHGRGRARAKSAAACGRLRQYTFARVDEASAFLAGPRLLRVPRLRDPDARSRLAPLFVIGRRGLARCPSRRHWRHLQITALSSTGPLTSAQPLLVHSFVVLCRLRPPRCGQQVYRDLAEVAARCHGTRPTSTSAVAIFAASPIGRSLDAWSPHLLKPASGVWSRRDVDASRQMSQWTSAAHHLHHRARGPESPEVAASPPALPISLQPTVSIPGRLDDHEQPANWPRRPARFPGAAPDLRPVSSPSQSTSRLPALGNGVVWSPAGRRQPLLRSRPVELWPCWPDMARAHVVDHSCAV